MDHKSWKETTFLLVDNAFILAFDVNDEKFRDIMMLPSNCSGWLDYHLSVVEGQPTLIVFGEGRRGLGFNLVCTIWVMREYGVVESWTKIIEREVPLKFFPEFSTITHTYQLLIAEQVFGRFKLHFGP